MQRILLLVLGLPLISFSQTNNSLDENGKKHGNWLAYVNDNMCVVDSSEATHQAYQIYSHGKLMFDLTCSKRRKELTAVLELTDSKLVNGKIQFFDNYESLIEEQVYKNGEIQTLISYNRSSETSYFWTEHFYFDRKHNDEVGTYYYTSETNTGETVSEGWFYDGPRGWKVYEKEGLEDKYIVMGDSSAHLYNVTDEEGYKFPYYGKNIPPYLAFMIGMQGITFPSVEAGIGFNIAETFMDNSTGSMLGGQLLFKYSLPTKLPEKVDTSIVPYDPFWTIGFEIGKYSKLTYGIGYNFNTDGTNVTHGINPFIGTSFYNVQLMFSYNFFSYNKNQIGRLLGSRLILRYAIPAVKLKKKAE